MSKLDRVLEILEDKQAVNINVIDFNHENILADYFVICESKNARQMDAIKHAFDEIRKDESLMVDAIEGNSDSGWIVIDVEGIFIHIFNPTTRAEYALDKLWSDYDQTLED